MEFSVKVLTRFSQRIVEFFVKKTNDQDEFGIKKYGQPLDPMDTRHDWLNMAGDELVDCFKYFIAERERRDNVLLKVDSRLNKVHSILTDNKPLTNYDKQLILSNIELLKNDIRAISHNLDGEVKGTTKYKEGKVVTID
jgi:hypothetical protein